GPNPEWMAPPGYMSKHAKPGNMARERRMSEGSYEAAIRAALIVTGGPDTIIQKFKHIIDRTDPGYLTFWAREGKKPHEATMRGIELLGREVIPALREHQSALVTGKGGDAMAAINGLPRLVDAAGIAVELRRRG